MHQQWNSITQETFIISAAIYFAVWNLPISIWSLSTIDQAVLRDRHSQHWWRWPGLIWCNSPYKITTFRTTHRQPLRHRLSSTLTCRCSRSAMSSKNVPVTREETGKQILWDTLHYTIRGKGKYHLTYTSLNMKQAVHVCKYIYQYPIRHVISIHRV